MIALPSLRAMWDGYVCSITLRKRKERGSVLERGIEIAKTAGGNDDDEDGQVPPTCVGGPSVESGGCFDDPVADKKKPHAGRSSARHTYNFP